MQTVARLTLRLRLSGQNLKLFLLPIPITGMDGMLNSIGNWQVSDRFLPSHIQNDCEIMHSISIAWYSE